MSIPMSALRRALLSALDRPGVQRVLPAPILGAGAGGAFGAAASALDGDISDAGEYAMTGATIGAGLGGIGVGAAVNRSLREALAEQAASRGIGRRAVREAADAEDGARFFSGFRTVPRSLDDVGPEEVALAAAGTGLGVLGGGGLLAITGGMAAQYQRAQRATGIEDLSMMTPEELSVLGHPELERDPELQAEAQQILMRHRKEVR